MEHLVSLNLLYGISGFCVGVLVGMTGVGGGSLMTPLLILLFGVHPTTAVGTDLLFAASTKATGTVVHAAARTVDWMLVCLLMIGSVPATLATLILLSRFDLKGVAAQHVITVTLGSVLLVTAVPNYRKKHSHTVCWSPEQARSAHRPPFHRRPWADHGCSGHRHFRWSWCDWSHRSTAAAPEDARRSYRRIGHCSWGAANTPGRCWSLVSWLCRLEPPREPIDRLIARYRFRQLSRNSRSRCRSSHDTRRRPFDCRCQVAGLTKVSLGQKHTSHFPIDVRFTPESGHELSGLGCPLSAKSGPQCANSSCRFRMWALPASRGRNPGISTWPPQTAETPDIGSFLAWR